MMEGTGHDPHPSARRYCPGCGGEVKVYVMLSAGGEVEHCEQCGAPITDDQAPAAAAPLENVIVVEDTALLREILADILKARGVTQNVYNCVNGSNFLSTFTSLLLKKSRVGLVILDINMPVMNGINAAIAMRAIERAFGLESPSPLLFFTVKPSDEQFRKLLKFCSPALYINKGTAATPLEMQERVNKVVNQLLKEREREESLW